MLVALCNKIAVALCNTTFSYFVVYINKQHYYNVRQVLLGRATGITKWDECYCEVWKVLLRSVTGITKCDKCYYKVRRYYKAWGYSNPNVHPARVCSARLQQLARPARPAGVPVGLAVVWSRAAVLQMAKVSPVSVRGTIHWLIAVSCDLTVPRKPDGEVTPHLFL